MKHNTRQLLIRLAAAPFQCSVCLRNRKSRQERFLNIRAGYIVSSKTWREISSR